MEKKYKKNVRNPLSSIAVKIYMGIIIFIIIPVSIGFFYSYRIFTKIITEEISKNNISNIAKFNEDVNDTLENMVSISNIVINDPSVQECLNNENSDYYKSSQIISKVFNNVSFYRYISSENVRITLLDTKGRIYSNWDNNYRFQQTLLNKDWVKEASNSNYSLVWSGFEPSYIENEQNIKYLSFARTVENSNYKSVGIVIISLSENEFKKIFNKYIPEKNGSMIISSKREGILTYEDYAGIIHSGEINTVIQGKNTESPGSMIVKINNKDYLVNYYDENRSAWTPLNKEWRITIISSYENIVSRLHDFSSKGTKIFLVGVIFLLIAAASITIQIFYPIRKLGQGMSQFNMGSKLDFIDLKRKDEIGNLNRSFYKMAENIKELFNNLQEEHAVKEKYRYESLRAQLNPHFLFNTLNTIRWMAIIIKAENIVQTIDALGNMLKYNMSNGEEFIPLRSELENIKSYLYIQNNRYGSSYEIQYEIEESFMELRILRFIIQPIVENAIIHGFDGSNGRGLIRIIGKEEGENLILKVEDNGVGMSGEEKERIFEEKEKKRHDKKVTGLGIKTVRDMVKIACGPQYGLEITSVKDQGTEVKLILPILREGNKNV